MALSKRVTELDSALSQVRRLLRPNYATWGSQFRYLEKFHADSSWIIRFFYIASLLLSYSLINSLSHKNPSEAYFLWPIKWLEIGNLKQLWMILPIGLFVISCAVVLKTESRTLRAAFALFLLFTTAAGNSFGAINHGWHIWFWISFILVFLPNRFTEPDRSRMLTTLSIIVYVQASILLTYSMAGSLKLIAGIKSLIAGEVGNFSVVGFASLLADRMTQGRGTTVLGGFFVDHPGLGFPLFVVLILIQTLSFPVAFFPRLHQAWGLILICFHLGTGLLMDIYFGTHILWLALFLVCSPFCVSRGQLERDQSRFFLKGMIPR